MSAPAPAVTSIHLRALFRATATAPTLFAWPCAAGSVTSVAQTAPGDSVTVAGVRHSVVESHRHEYLFQLTLPTDSRHAFIFVWQQNDARHESAVDYLTPAGAVSWFHAGLQGALTADAADSDVWLTRPNSPLFQLHLESLAWQPLAGGPAPSVHHVELSSFHAAHGTFAVQAGTGLLGGEGHATFCAPSAAELNLYLDLYLDSITRIGRAVLDASLFKNLRGTLTAPVVTSTLSVAGTVSLRFLVATPAPVPVAQAPTRLTGLRHWWKHRAALSCGHRGTGGNRVAVRGDHTHENTLAALMRASAEGADMVEFDVQLTQDEVPVLFHDGFIGLKGQSEAFTVPIGRISYDDVRTLTPEFTTYSANRPSKKPLQSQKVANPVPAVSEALFPLFSDALTQVPLSTGFDVEVKYNELGYALERNAFVDRVLLTMSQAPDLGRNIIFSSFDRDVCTLLQLKQSRWGVLQLCSMGKSPMPSVVHRLTLAEAMAQTRTSHLAGVVIYWDLLLPERGQLAACVAETQARALIVGTYGDQNNDVAAVRHQLAALRSDFICTDHLSGTAPFAEILA